MMGDHDECLSHAWYWDEHYLKADGENPTHEWFRSFGDLEPFFRKHIFDSPGHRPNDSPVVLHLGSGDSVS